MFEPCTHFPFRPLLPKRYATIWVSWGSWHVPPVAKKIRGQVTLFGGDSLINLFPMLREQQTPNTTPQDFFPYTPEISHHCSGSCLFQITVFSIYMRFPNLSPAISLAKKKQELDFKVSPCFFVQRICHDFFLLKNAL